MSYFEASRFQRWIISTTLFTIEYFYLLFKIFFINNHTNSFPFQLFSSYQINYLTTEGFRKMSGKKTFPFISEKKKKKKPMGIKIAFALSETCRTSRWSTNENDESYKWVEICNSVNWCFCSEIQRGGDGGTK